MLSWLYSSGSGGIFPFLLFLLWVYLCLPSCHEASGSSGSSSSRHHGLACGLKMRAVSQPGLRQQVLLLARAFIDGSPWNPLLDAIHPTWHNLAGTSSGDGSSRSGESNIGSKATPVESNGEPTESLPLLRYNSSALAKLTPAAVVDKLNRFIVSLMGYFVRANISAVSSAPHLSS